MASTTTNDNEAWLTGPGATQFFTRTWAPAGPPKACLVFVHGFIEHVGRYEHVFPSYAKRDIAVFAFDQRGFGRTALDNTKRSRDSAYGKTSLQHQLEDLKWVFGEAGKKWPQTPLFLMGHSMGGGEVLSYCIKTSDLPIKGVIASSPLLLQATPASKLLRWVGARASFFVPNASFPAEVKPEDLSRDPKVGEAYMADPYVQFKGTLRGISTMLEGGEYLVNHGYKQWPKSLPVLFVHGTADKVTSHLATEKFYNNIVADDKHLSLYDGCYHELVNEIDGVKERVIEECVSWIEGRLSSDAPVAKL